ncbi:MAG: fibronectin type III domain-containing protein [Elusimicrobia bacterium]|nr:fibronectin type III domain-containing protein [Elusimicrobiota bacterium]
MLIPNTTYFRFVTAFTEWGDSLPSLSVSTHTLANTPVPASFSDMSTTSLTVNWTAGSPPNPWYTSYQIVRSTNSDFSSAVSTNFVAGLSSSPQSLTPNTTYHFRVRAVNLDGVQTDFTDTLSTATLAAIPSTHTLTVYVTSISFSWSAGNNPPWTQYQAEISTDNFFTLADSSRTLGASATFYNLSPGQQYFLHVSARNHNGIDSDYSALLSTVPGNLANVSPPTAPGAPQPDRKYSYDGKAAFSWTPASSPVGILDYFLDIGTVVGASVFFSSKNVGGALSYTVSDLENGKTYFARVKARSNAGVPSDYSPVGPGVVAYLPAQAPQSRTPINWPNPFDPEQGPTQIGFFLEEPATVTFKLYTLQGELVHEESRRVDSTGNQVWTWTGANDSGGRAAPGGYIGMIRKQYSGRTETQKFKLAVLY